MPLLDLSDTSHFSELLRRAVPLEVEDFISDWEAGILLAMDSAVYWKRLKTQEVWSLYFLKCPS